MTTKNLNSIFEKRKTAILFTHSSGKPMLHDGKPLIVRIERGLNPRQERIAIDLEFMNMGLLKPAAFAALYPA